VNGKKQTVNSQVLVEIRQFNNKAITIISLKQP